MSNESIKLNSFGELIKTLKENNVETSSEELNSIFMNTVKDDNTVTGDDFAKAISEKYNIDNNDYIINIIEQMSANDGVSDSLSIDDINFETSLEFVNSLEAEDREIIKQALLDQVETLQSALDETKSNNGIIGKAWDGFKNLTGLGAGSNKAQSKIDDLKSKIESASADDLASLYKEVMNTNLTAEECQNFINGESNLYSTDAANAVVKYQNGQEAVVNTTADIVSGVSAFACYAAALGGAVAAPFTGGVSLAVTAGAIGLASAAGAGSKVAIKAIDSASSGNYDYSLKEAGKDALSGAINGPLAALTAGVSYGVAKIGAKLGIGAAKTAAAAAESKIVVGLGKSVSKETATALFEYGVDKGIIGLGEEAVSSLSASIENSTGQALINDTAESTMRYAFKEMNTQSIRTVAADTLGNATKKELLALDSKILQGLAQNSSSSAVAGLLENSTQSTQSQLLQRLGFKTAQGSMNGAAMGSMSSGSDYIIDTAFDENKEFNAAELAKYTAAGAIGGGAVGGFIGLAGGVISENSGKIKNILNSNKNIDTTYSVVTEDGSEILQTSKSLTVQNSGSQVPSVITDTNSLITVQSSAIQNAAATNGNIIGKSVSSSFAKASEILANPSSSKEACKEALSNACKDIIESQNSVISTYSPQQISQQITNSSILKQNPELAEEIIDTITQNAGKTDFASSLKDISATHKLWVSNSGITLNSVSNYINSKSGGKSVEGSYAILVDKNFITRYESDNAFRQEVNELIQNNSDISVYNAQNINPFSTDYITNAEELMPKVTQLLTSNPELSVEEAVSEVQAQSIPQELQDIMQERELTLMEMPSKSTSSNSGVEGISERLNQGIANPEDLEEIVSNFTSNPKDQNLLIGYLQNNLTVDSTQSEISLMKNIGEQLETSGIAVNGENTYYYVPRETHPRTNEVITKSSDRVTYMFSELFNIDSNHIITDIEQIPEGADIICLDDFAGSGKSLIGYVPDRLAATGKEYKSITMAPLNLTRGTSIYNKDDGHLDIQKFTDAFSSADKAQQDEIIKKLQSSEIFDIAVYLLNSENQNDANYELTKSIFIERLRDQKTLQEEATSNLFNGSLNNTEFNYISGRTVDSLYANDYYLSLSSEDQERLRELLGFPNGIIMGYADSATSYIGPIMSTNTNMAFISKLSNLFQTNPKYPAVYVNGVNVKATDFNNVQISENTVGFIKFSNKKTAVMIGDVQFSSTFLSDSSEKNKNVYLLEGEDGSSYTLIQELNKNQQTTNAILIDNNNNLTSYDIIKPDGAKVFIINKR